MRLPWDRPVDEAHLPAHWFGRMLTALYFSTFMIRASFAIMLISFPIYIIGLKSYFLFGIVVSSSPIFELITVLGLGAYIDKHGRKNVLLLGLLVGSLALFALLLTKNPVPLFIINAFHGASAAAILVSSLALIADYAPPAKRGKLMGIFDFTNLFGWIVGFGIGGLLIDTYKDNIGMTFVVAGALGLVGWAWATLNVIEPHRQAHLASDISFRSIASVIKQRSVILLIAPWFIIYLLVSTMLTFTSKAGTQELGLTGRDLAVLLGGGGTVFLITQFAYGWASDKYGRTRIMIVGTVGIVGIMLTVGGVFLTAPAVVAPAVRSVAIVQLDGDPAPEFVLQSEAGVYLVDANGTVLKEMAPPEGGFGRLSVAPSGAELKYLVSATKQSVQLISVASGAVTWIEAAHEPRHVRPADLDADQTPEIFYVDKSGLHLTGPQVPPGAPALPPALDATSVRDALWHLDTLYLLAGSADQSVVWEIGVSSARNATFPVNYSELRSGDYSLGASVLALSPAGADLLSLANGTIDHHFDLPAGLEVSAVMTGPSGYEVFAYPPAGGGALAFYRNGSAFERSGVSLPGDLSVSSLVRWNGTTVFIGYTPNGTLSSTTLLRTGSSWTASSESAAVLVKRETAQATFAKLTSPSLVVPLVIFGLMAGAFGPAALAGLTDVSQSDKRGTTMGLYSVVISSSMIVGPIVTGFLVDNYGGFGVMLFLVLSAAAMALFMALRALDVRSRGGEEFELERDAAGAEGAPRAATPIDAGAKGASEEE